VSSNRVLLADHLGSTVEALDAAGNTLPGSEIKYWPYGATRAASVNGTQRTDLLYTGQRQEPGDAALGLYNYKARFYSTTLGRFVSADPVVGSVGDPQSWNAYTYVRNNPLRLVDPSGMRWIEEKDDPPPPPDPYIERAAAEAWVSAPAGQPYEPCTTCIAWAAAWYLFWVAERSDPQVLPSRRRGERTATARRSCSRRPLAASCAAAAPGPAPSSLRATLASRPASRCGQAHPRSPSSARPGRRDRRGWGC